MTIFNNGDRFKDSWGRILFQPHTPLQSQELIELQAILFNNQKKVLDTIFENGRIMEGLEISTIPQTDSTILVNITTGYIYTEGLALKVDPSSFSIPSTGEYIIGVLVSTNIVTYEEDSSLVDNTYIARPLGLAGANRLDITTTITVNNEEALPIARINNGTILRKNYSPYSNLEQVVSTFIYERLGNFCIQGLEARVLNITTPTVSDDLNYRNLEAQINEQRIAIQTKLAEYEDIKVNKTNLDLRLEEAITTANLSPTAENLSIVQSLESQIEEADDSLDKLLGEIVSLNNIINTSTRNLSRLQEQLIDTVSVSINPGIVYLMGKRVEFISNSVVKVPKVLGARTVDSVVFSNISSNASNRRELIPSLTFSINNLKTPATRITITFDKILYQGAVVKVETSFLINTALTFLASTDTVREVTKFIVDELNKPIGVEPHPNVTFTSTDLVNNATQLRTIIKSNVYTKMDYNGTTAELLFTSTSTLESSNQIEIKVDIINTQTNLSSTHLSVDIQTARLLGAKNFNDYRLGFRPVKQIVSLVADLEENMLPVTRDVTPGTADLLGDDSIIEILEVRQGDKVFIQGEDYTLFRQSRIDWSSPTGEEPAPGTTYYVSYIYTAPLTEDTDFYLDRTTDTIVFIGRAPAQNRTFRVTYNYFLSRAGLIYIDRDSNINYSLSELADNPITPKIDTRSSLPIATFILSADEVLINNVNCKPLKAEDINIINNKLFETTNNLEALRLRLDGYLDSNTTVINDSLKDLEIYTFNLASKISVSIINPISINPIIKVGLSKVSSIVIPLSLNFAPLIVFDNHGQDYLASVDYGERVYISQSKITDTLPIKSPIKLFKNKHRGIMIITPRSIFLNNTDLVYTPYDPLVGDNNLALRLDSSLEVYKTIREGVERQYTSLASSLSTSIQTNRPVVSIDIDRCKALHSICNLVTSPNESITISISVINIPSSEDGYLLYFDNQVVSANDYTLVYNTLPSTDIESGFMSRVEGKIDIKFNLPPSLKTGLYTIRIESPTAIAENYVAIYNTHLHTLVNTAINNWTGDTVNNQFSLVPALTSISAAIETVANLPTDNSIPIASPLSQNILRSYKYPIVQTLTIEEDITLTKVRIKLAHIPTRLKSQISIVFTDSYHNLPSNNILGVALPSSIVESDTEWSEFTFSPPVFLNKNTTYCLCLEYDRNWSEGLDNFEVYYSVIGKKDKYGVSIGNQLYSSGFLYTSDGETYSRVVNSDLAYELVSAVYEPAGIIDLGTYAADPILNAGNGFSVNCRVYAPDESDITFRYSTNTTTEFNTFSVNQVVKTPNPFRTVTIQAVVSTINKNVSPVIELMGAGVEIYKVNNNNGSPILGEFTSNLITPTSAFTKVKIIVTALHIDNLYNDVVVKISTDNGVSYITADSVTPTVLDALSDYKKISFNFILGSPATTYTYKVELEHTNITLNIPVIKSIVNYVW